MNRKAKNNVSLTNAKDDSVDVHCGEVEEEEREVYNEEREAQNHTDPLLQPLSYKDNKHINAHYCIFCAKNLTKKSESESDHFFYCH